MKKIIGKVIGKVVEIGDDGEGNPAIVIQTTRGAIQRLERNLLYRDVEITELTYAENEH